MQILLEWIEEWNTAGDLFLFIFSVSVPREATMDQIIITNLLLLLGNPIADC
jgi:hypothetical protein